MLQAFAGIFGIVAIAWLASESRRGIPWRTVWSGLLLQFVLALLLLKLPGAKEAFLWLNGVLGGLEKATMAGTALVFGYLGGGTAPYVVSDPASSFILAFRALPIVLVVSALSALLFHWGILGALVRAISWLLERTMRVGGVVGLSTAANVFVGMVEAPLVVQPWLARISRGELFVIMAGGMASIAGTVLFLYASILGSAIPDAIAHLLVASVVSAPAAIVIAVIMVPPDSHPTGGEATGARLELRSDASGAMDALTRGTLGGVQLLLNIVAMLVVFVALVALVNLAIAPLTLQGGLGYLLAPLAWLAGVPWSEAQVAGALLGTKTVVNEFVAYLDMAKLTDDELSPRSRLLMTYAMCGFANLGSLGIMIGGMGTMCPERRSEIVGLGFRSIVAGTLATCLTAATVGMIV